MTSYDSDQKTIYELINGEIFWVLITDHFIGMKHEDERISKASPINSLRNFLNQYNPTCNEKYIHLDEGVKLSNNPDVKYLLQQFGYNLHPTEADNPHQNGPVEWAHMVLDNSIRDIITGANLDIKCWPYTLYYFVWISNSFLEPDTITSPIEKFTYKLDNLSSLQTFGFHVYVIPSVKKKDKLKNHIYKGIFLVYDPHATKNVLYYLFVVQGPYTYLRHR